MREDEKDTVINTNKILDAINALRQETNEHFAQFEDRFTRLEDRFARLEDRLEQFEARTEQRFEDMRLQLMSFDVRIDRVEASVYKVLDITINTRADVKVLREEVSAWAKDVRQLQNA